MILLRLTLLTTLCFCDVQAVLNGKELKIRDAGFDSYGLPPRPATQYGPPPHRDYGVPQQIPFREYGPPALKYGPPKLNFLGGGPSSSASSGLHEQIKTHFGVPKPFYGPPHILNKYGPHPQKLVYRPQEPQYGPPAPQYGPPPLKLQHRPAPQYGLPPQKPQYSVPLTLPQPLPAPHPAPQFKPAHQPATSYGPPPSGPLNLPPKPVFETPPNYGPPPLPVNIPGPQPTSFNRQPETTIILSGPGGQQPTSGTVDGPINQVQIQIDASGHTHSLSGSQAPFHTACDGWKPIPAPIGSYVEQNHIETQGGYSNVHKGLSHSNSHSFGTQHSVGSGTVGSSIVDGLSDEQLVAVALHGEGNNIVTGPGHDDHLNTIDPNAQQVSVGSFDDSYSIPPADSYSPGSVLAHKYRTNVGSPGLTLTSRVPETNFGPPQPQSAALTRNHAQSEVHTYSNSNVNTQYVPPLANPHYFPQRVAGHPNKPVTYRPPVPTGLLESIGATVQHLDQFGVRPPQQPPPYIPPATHEIALGGQPTLPQTVYGTALSQPAPPQAIVQQQLPQPQPGQNFINHKSASLQQYIPPGQLPLPQPHYLPPAHAPALQQYLPISPHGIFLQQQNQQSKNSYSASQYTQQFVQSQGLPVAQQELRFNQQPIQGQHLETLLVHDCGHGPKLVSSNGYEVQQPQQLGSVSAASTTAFKAIAQSIPVVEQHTQFLVGHDDSYGPPPSGNDIDFDHSGYATTNFEVAALPDGTDPAQLPGLDGLDVFSAQKSQSIKLGSSGQQPAQNFQVQFDSSLNNSAGGTNSAALHGANHAEILSQGLLQSILTAIEQPQSSFALSQNHRAQSRTSEQHHDEENKQQSYEQDEKETEPSASNRVEVRLLPNTNVIEDSPDEKVKRIEPIVAVEVEDDAKH